MHGGRACCGVNSNSRSSRAFSAPNRATCSRSAVSSHSNAASGRAPSSPGPECVGTCPYSRGIASIPAARLDRAGRARNRGLLQRLRPGLRLARRRTRRTIPDHWSRRSRHRNQGRIDRRQSGRGRVGGKGTRQRLPILDLPLPAPPPAGPSGSRPTVVGASRRSMTGE